MGSSGQTEEITLGAHRIPQNVAEIKLNITPATMPKRDHADGLLMGALARCGWIQPVAVPVRDGDCFVWIGSPRRSEVNSATGLQQSPTRPPDLVVPKKRWRRNFKRLRNYINSHHLYWQLQADAAHRLAIGEST